MLIDTHAHLYAEEFDEDFEQVVSQAKAAGITHIVLPSISKEEYPRLIKTLHTDPSMFSAALGLHPAYVKEDYREQLDFIRQHLHSEKWVAIGEIGLDYYWSTDYKKAQHDALHEQLKLALELDLPVIFHVRNAFADLIKVLSQAEYKEIRGIIHSFTGTEEELKAVLAFPNLMIAINGVATFKNATLREYIGQIPPDRILVETDAPYLAPVPMRGKRNEPAFVAKTAEHIAPLWGMTLEKFSHVTTENAKRLFSLIWD